MPRRRSNLSRVTRAASIMRQKNAELTEEERLALNARRRQRMAEARAKLKAERFAAAREGGQRPLSPYSRSRAQRNECERLINAKIKGETEEQRQAQLQVKTSVLKSDSDKPQRYSQNDIECDELIVKEEDWCKDLEYDDKLLDTKLLYINESSATKRTARCGTFEPIIFQDEKLFACTLCNAKYKYKGNYKRHMLSHMDQATYKCALCPKQYNWISQLRRHIVKHSKEKPFTCSGCDQQFKYKHNFKRHVLSHTVHGIYNCEVCDKQYNWITLLRYHMLKHTNENPFTCAVCKEQFIYNGNYKIHVASHSK